MDDRKTKALGEVMQAQKGDLVRVVSKDDTTPKGHSVCVGRLIIIRPTYFEVQVGAYDVFMYSRRLWEALTIITTEE